MSDHCSNSVAICAIFRNESRYLQEWIEFHRLVGVERFFLYQNRSDDDWLSVLEPYIDDNVVELTDWPMAAPCQLEAYRHFIEKHKSRRFWTAFIDCDEFLFSPASGTIQGALATLPPEWGAVGVNWMCFGASGQEAVSDGLVTERFTLRPPASFSANCHIKSIVRMERIESTIADPHYLRVNGGTCNEAGIELTGPSTARPVHNLLRINHYHTKSRQEYLERVARGRADLGWPRSASEFDEYQSAAVDDRAIWRFLPALKERLERTASRSPAKNTSTPVEPIHSLGEWPVTRENSAAATRERSPLLSAWDPEPESVDVEGDVIVLSANSGFAPGSETGLIGLSHYYGVRMSFEVMVDRNATFIAKIHQVEQRNQQSNSYHLMLHSRGGYLARHGHVFRHVSLAPRRWESFALIWNEGVLSLEVNGRTVCKIQDAQITSGYCFLGVKAGTARLRNLHVAEDSGQGVTKPVASPSADRRYRILFDSGADRKATVSIVTTVFDRVECLDACLRSVQGLRFDDYEHIVVADSPTAAITERIRSLVTRLSTDRCRLVLAVLESRANDWGITPATIGLSLARGRYVCFLSDDNAYRPEYLEKLVAALDQNQDLGFAYSGCLYDGRMILNTAPPALGRIDLGQPLFRRDLFERFLGDALPFREHAWDWLLIKHFLDKGVRWKHINEINFVFHLQKYPGLVLAPRAAEGISYCIPCYRPVYARHLIEELIAKTSARFEILLWLNVAAPDFEEFLLGRAREGADIRILGCTPENIGMACFPALFEAAKYDMVTQIDDDVVCISPGIAETARATFDRFPEVGMLTSDVWQDEYTNGARPSMDHYRLFDSDYGLYEGPIDGWFAVYRRQSLDLCRNIRPSRYFCLGSTIKQHLGSIGLRGLLCAHMKVLHINNPEYAAHFGMLHSEIAKYRSLGMQNLADHFVARSAHFPDESVVREKIRHIREALAIPVRQCKQETS